MFATEIDAHAGVLEARRLPEVPRGHPERRDIVRRVHLGVIDRQPAQEARGARQTGRQLEEGSPPLPWLDTLASCGRELSDTPTTVATRDRR